MPAAISARTACPVAAIALGVAMRSGSPFRRWADRFLVLLHHFLQHAEQRPGRTWCHDDSGVNQSFSGIAISLTKVDQEFVFCVSQLKVVGGATFDRHVFSSSPSTPQTSHAHICSSAWEMPKGFGDKWLVFSVKCECEGGM